MNESRIASGWHRLAAMLLMVTPPSSRQCFRFRKSRLAIAAVLLLSGTTPFARAKSAPPVSRDVTAPAVALGNAFAHIVGKSKGFVVSVLSEKVVKMRNDEFPFPFGDRFFHQFFGQSGPGTGSGEGQAPGAVPGPPQSVPVAGLGSGVILDEKGHILTNDHVVQGMEKIHVVLPDKQSYEAKVLGSDPKTDLAVLQLKGKFPKDLTVAPLGNSDRLKVGNLVLAFGAPFGLTQTVTSGIVSATGRSNVGIADLEDFIQTDAPINPGNSGGPLVDMHGNVVGINTAIATDVGQSAGVGFAIPINMAKEILPTLLKGKKVQRGMLGIGIQDLNRPLERQFHAPGAQGALVSQVNPDSPAKKAGIKPGDVIVKFDGKQVADSTQLREMVARTAPGTKADITVYRDGRKLKLPVKLGELRPTEVASSNAAQPAASTQLEKFGIRARNLTPELRTEFNIQAHQGIVITHISPTGPAAMSGLRPGDVITEIDRKKVDSLSAAKRILASAKKKNETVLLVNHHGSSVYVGLETG